MVTIRSLQECDAGRCSEIAIEAFTEEIQLGMPSFSPEYFTSRLLSKRVKMVVAEDENIVGFMIVTDANVEVPAQLHLVAVDKDWQGQGIGKQLVQHAIDYIVENE